MKKLIIANWKLNPTTLKEAHKLAGSIEHKAKHNVVLCPPTIFLASVAYPQLGAQDAFWQDKGPYTGQTSPEQLKDLGIKYCLLGHSEKRALGESDEMVNAKARQLLRHKVTPVVCVGFGTKVDQDDLEVTDVLKSQLEIDLKDIDPSKVVVAYEPVWAIGTGHNATPEHAEKISIFIKSRYQIKTILYGGSVNIANAKAFLQQSNVGGLLVGGASLVAKDFNHIINL